MPRPARISKQDKLSLIEEKIRNEIIWPSSLSVKFIDQFKGHGVFTDKFIQAGDFIHYYSGDRLELDPLDNDTYVFAIKSGKKQIWIDATNTNHLCRYFNDAHNQPNMLVKIIKVDQELPPVFVAARDIKEGEELTYYYGPGDHYWRYDKSSKKRSIKSDKAR